MRPPKNWLIYLIIGACVVFLGFVVLRGVNAPPPSKTLDYSQVLTMASQHQIKTVEVASNNQLLITLTDGSQAISQAPEGAAATLCDKMATANVTCRVDSTGQNNQLLQVILPNLLIFLILGGLFWYVLRQTQSGNNQAMSFGRSKARMFSGDKPSITFVDVAGVDEAKQELTEVVEFLKYPEKFTALGARIPKGVLLIGPPGTGKTLLSKAVAGEAGVPFFSISGSEFVEMFVGVGASRVRDLFDQAKKNSPCIVFVDEIDAVGRQRGAGLGGGHDEREQTLNQLLVEMDGFDTNTNVIVIAATNRPDVLDPALLRPGRFDRQVVLDRSDINGRLAILKVHARGKPLDESVDLEVIARQTPGFSGADLSNILNEAAILAARADKKVVTMHEMEESIVRVMAGPERKSRVITPHEKSVIAYHEVGHALVGKNLEHADPIHKVSIISRGMALGITMSLPTEDRYLVTKSELEDKMAMAMGGRCAEEIIFGEITTGARQDIEESTKTARRMVMEFGMSEKLGPLAYGHKEEMIFLGRDLGDQRNYSDEVAATIDQEIHHLVETAYQRAKAILSDKKADLVKVAEFLKEAETIDGPQLDALINGDGTAPPSAPAPVTPSPTPTERKPERVGMPSPARPPLPAPAS
jgi:cell division protease FtsH